MTFNYPNLTTTDPMDSWLNGFKDKVKGVINSFPGVLIQDGTISVGKLAKPRARGTWSFCTTDVMDNNTFTRLFQRTVLNSDGAAATYNIVGWSVSVNRVKAQTTLVGSDVATLTWYKNGGSPFLTIDISTGTALAIGTPLSADLSASPLTVAGGDILGCDYNWATTAGAKYPGLQVHLDWTLPHAGT